MSWIDKFAIAVLIWIAACGAVGLMMIWSVKDVFESIMRKCL